MWVVARRHDQGVGDQAGVLDERGAAAVEDRERVVPAGELGSRVAADAEGIEHMHILRLRAVMGRKACQITFGIDDQH
ncbi:MAG: hypothetical protein AAF656_02380 [Planctomycetota bacterium]